MKSNKPLSASGIALLVIILGTIGVICFFVFSKFLTSHIEAELYKYSFQFLLLGVIGGAVSLVFTNLTKEKEQRLKKHEKNEAKANEIKIAQHKFHNEFVQSYNSVKLIRRMFRARARILSDKEIMLDTKVYDTLMQELTKQQLQFEFYIDEAESNPNLFDDKKVNSVLQGKIELIQEYLNEIVSEYEKCYKLSPNYSFINNLQTLPLSELPALGDFIIKYEETGVFNKKFRTPAKDVQKLLQQLISPLH